MKFNKYDLTYGPSPCFDCPERELGCHGRCRNYKLYKKRIRNTKEKIKKEKEGLYAN
ncbi:MAG: hypothetical protein M0R77_21290 [Gammaproteobacteria bacterium]|jgi:hypothetical protein|nr:hypothetical protein [Gammaproteobacteria bacterium]MDY0101075.1 hypothetical protein [Bacilli bacterium]